MKEHLIMPNVLEKEFIDTQMEMFIMETLLIKKRRAMVSIPLSKMVQFMMGSGRKIGDMEKESIHLKMAHII